MEIKNDNAKNEDINISKKDNNKISNNNKNEKENNNENENKNAVNNMEDKKTNDEEKNYNTTKHPSKNYIIKKPPERKKNRANDEELKNKAYGFGFLNNRKSNISKKEENDKNIINKEKQENIIENTNNTNTNLTSKEVEEEKNKLSYRQLMAKKCQNIIKLENEKKEENLLVNNIKVLKDEKEKEINKDNIKENVILQKKKEENEDKKRSKTINNTKHNDTFSTKEGTLKILQLIKAKKNEKNLLDEKMKETKNNLKEDIDPKKENVEDINLDDNKKNINLTPVKKEPQEDSLKLSINITENNINNNKTEISITDNNKDNSNNKNQREKEKEKNIERIEKEKDKSTEIIEKDKDKDKSIEITYNNNKDNSNNKNQGEKEKEKEKEKNIERIEKEKNIEIIDKEKEKSIEIIDKEKNEKNYNTIKSEKSDLIAKKQIYKKFKGKGKSCLIGNSNNNFLPLKNKLEKEQPNNTFIHQEKAEKSKIIMRNTINKHHTSLNISKKHYIIKPKELDLNQEENNINNLNNKIHIEENYNINNNYEKINTFQNQKNLNWNNNNLYEPKKSLIYNNNNKNLYNERILDLNKENKSPSKINNSKMTYIKKCLFNNSSSNSGHKSNNSFGNVSPFINNNFDSDKLLRNNMSTQIDYNKININNNLNSSFKLANELGKTYYNIGNIFNMDNIEDDNNNINLSNNFNINFNLDSIYNINYRLKKNKVKPRTGYNTFYPNNYYADNNNIFDKVEKNFELKNIYNRNSNYQKRIQINNIYNQYENSGIKNNINKIYENKVNKSFKGKIIYSNDLFQSLNYEDLLILEDKLKTIMISLNEEKIISNDCFEFWNYFFNNSLYENFNNFYSNYDNEYKNMFKKSINYLLISIMLSYDISFEKKKLEKISPLLKEMLEFSYKLLIILFEYILNIIPFTYSNVWIKKISNLIHKSKLLDDSDSFLVEPEKITEKEKLNLNINFLSKKIYYILTNYPSNNSQKFLSNFFKRKYQDTSISDINNFFLENIFREKDFKHSILAHSFLKKGGKLFTPNSPYLNIPKSNKYYLVCDIDETLFNFKLSEEDQEQGVLKIRPGVFQLIEEIRPYYQIILFSEADRDYIEVIIEAICSTRYLYDYILSRDYVSIEGNNFIKDISKIGTPLDKTIIIDNMPQNFRKNKENAIYIKSFFGENNNDKALIDLIPILVNIAKSGNDVRNELIKYKEKIVDKISSNFDVNNN